MAISRGLLMGSIASAFATAAGAHTAADPGLGADRGQGPSAPPSTTAASALPAVIRPQPEGDSAITDIVVTATRREERLQRIPVTVTAIGAAALASGGVTDTRGLTLVVPGLTMTRSGSVGQPVVRGVGSTGTSGGDESNVATYIDGVYQADPYSTLIELVNVQRVEVLRGPQGTVFGRNATGGLINIITPDPSFKTSGSISAAYSRMRNDSNGADIRGYVTGPLSETVAADFSALYRHEDGFIDDLRSDRTYGGSSVVAVRGKLLFKPRQGIKIVLTSDYAKQDGESGVAYQPVGRFTRGIGYAGVILPVSPWQASFDVDPVLKYKRFSVSLRTSFDLGFANLETTGAYNYGKASQTTDLDGTNIPIAAASPTFATKSYSQEIRLLSNPGRFNWLAGLYGFHLGSDGNVLISNSPAPPAPLASFTLSPQTRTTSFAGFVEGTYEVVPKLFVTAGGRYSTEERSIVSYRNGALLIPHTSRRYNRATYRLAARYQLTEKTSLYGSYGTGFKSGVFNGVAAVLNVVEPESIKAFEGGIKSDPARWLRMNISAFHYQYDNLQVTARDPVRIGTFLLQNAATAKIYGSELEVTLAPTRDFSVSGSLAYLHARYTDFPRAQAFLPLPSGANQAAAVDASGNQLVRSPKWTFNVAPRWSHELGGGKIEVSANLFHSTRAYWDFANTRAFSRDPYTLVSGDVGFVRNRWRFGLAATNILDKAVPQQFVIGAPGTMALLDRPRRVTLSARYAFG